METTHKRAAFLLIFQEIVEKRKERNHLRVHHWHLWFKFRSLKKLMDCLQIRSWHLILFILLKINIHLHQHCYEESGGFQMEMETL
jgi:hypothetical protein